MDDLLLKNFDKFICNYYDDTYLNKFLNGLKNKEYIIIHYRNLKIVKIKGLLIYLSKECFYVVTHNYEYTFFIDDESEIDLIVEWF